MKQHTLSRRSILGGLSAAAVIAPPPWRAARAAGPVQLLSHRYPALEFWAGKMQSAIPGITVNAQLMPFDKQMELVNIGMAAKASTIDLLYVIDSNIATYARNGWLRPLDDLWAKYKDEFKLGDFSEGAIRGVSWNGHIYAVPGTVNTMLFFYRRDLFDQAGKKPPETIAEYQALAKFFNSPMRAGTVACLKPVDNGLSEAHWYMNTIGAGWFDDTWHPIFNNERGVRAIEALKETTRSAQQGFTTAGNDECTVAFQQDAAAMGQQWATRARSVDDTRQSRVVGKFAWTAMPEGHARLITDGYAISAYSQQDPDVLFRILATATRDENMREAAGMLVPPRQPILADPAMLEKNRFYPAAAAAIASGVPFPALPEFYAVAEFISRGIVRGVTGEQPIKAALDSAAGETETFLKARGYKL